MLPTRFAGRAKSESTFRQGRSFVADMKKKKIYSSNDLRLRELSEKVDSEDTFVFKEATYM